MTDKPDLETVHSPPVVLARQAIQTYVTEGTVLEAPQPLPEMFQTRAGAFVSLHKHGQLRGCIGTIEPVQPSLAEEIIHNAIAASTQDPRFPPVRPEELADLEISVDVLNPPEPVPDLGHFDPRRYGMIVRLGSRRGLLLPDLEGVDTPEEQFAICCRKAGIPAGAPVQLYRFTVTRYH